MKKNNRIPLITTPIVISEYAFVMRCPLEHCGSVQHSFIHHPAIHIDTQPALNFDFNMQTCYIPDYFATKDKAVNDATKIPRGNPSR